MILSDFKRKNVKRKTRKFLKKNIEVNATSNAKIKTILLLVDKNTPTDLLKTINEEFNVKSLDNHIILFREKIDKKDDCQNCISKKDFGIFGNFKNKDVKKIIIQPIDLLINYVSNNTYLNNLAVKSNANFKVGFIDDNKHIYDLMIDVKKNNYTTFNTELKKYLKILNKI